MYLTGTAILNEMTAGRIGISDFDEKRLNPNSYNLRLANKLVEIQGPLDMRQKPEGKDIDLAECPKGFLLTPGKLYLGHTVEKVHTDFFVPGIVGRSSIGRLGISVHQTAGFGDIGFDGVWTLGISVIVPVTIYPGVEICQVYFVKTQGYIENLYSGKYQGSTSLEQSQLFTEL